MSNKSFLVSISLLILLIHSPISSSDIFEGARVKDPDVDPRVYDPDHAFFAFSFIAIESLYIIEDRYDFRFGAGRDQAEIMLKIMTTKEYQELYTLRRSKYCADGTKAKTIICMDGFRG